MKKRFSVFNATDNIPASYGWLTEEQADQFIKDFPARFKMQGYYKTGSGHRISPDQVELEKREATPPKLAEILDFDVCELLVSDAVAKGSTDNVILCPHYSINIAAKYEDGEELQYDWEIMEDYIGYSLEVSDYDDLIVNLNTED